MEKGQLPVRKEGEDLQLAVDRAQAALPTREAERLQAQADLAQTQLNLTHSEIHATVGAFMAVLDIQITNSSLKDIQGALSATLEEGSWISTSYLVAEIIMPPLPPGWCSCFRHGDWRPGFAWDS